MLCGGITSASPLFNENVGPGSKVGVVGLGGEQLAVPLFLRIAKEDRLTGSLQVSDTTPFFSPRRSALRSRSSRTLRTRKTTL